jgi:hypothetical protein
MLTALMVTMALLASVVLPVAGVVAVVTYVRRARQLERIEGDGTPYAAVLDNLDQVHIRLDAISARLARIEEGMKVDRGSRSDALNTGDEGGTAPRAIGE